MKKQDDFIHNTIRKRTEIYYLVTEKDLKELKSKSLYSEIAYISTSLLLSTFLSVLITRIVNTELSESTDNLLFSLQIIVGIVGFISLLIALYFSYLRNSEINNIKGQEDISLTVENYKSSINPNHLIGNDLLLVNISVLDRDKFIRLYNIYEAFELLNFETHENKKKTDYFTFKILNASEPASNHFKKFLDENKIKYTDYNFKHLIINNATYGANNKVFDVTDKLNTLIRNNSLTIRASNDIAGDPIHGTVKQLVVNYSFGKTSKEIVIKENKILKIP
jgi:hypothetical protein